MEQTQQTQIVVSGALFSAEGKVLLVRRNKRAGHGETWELPGGELDFGEAPEFGAMRCFTEITGVEASVDRPLGAWSELLPRGSEGASVFRVHIDYTLRSSGAMTGVDLDRDRCAGFAWLTLPEAQAKLTSPALRASVERAFGLLARSRKNG